MAVGPLPVGRVVAPASLRASAFARVLAHREAIVLGPSSSRGWFGGRCLVAWAPVYSRQATLAEAGDALERGYRGERPGVAVALLSYEGACSVMHFTGALVLEGDGWRCFGDPAGDLDAVVAAATTAAGEMPEPVNPGESLLQHAQWSLSDRQYRARVQDVRESIASGDVYVLNLTSKLVGTTPFAPEQCFDTLLTRAGSDMNAFVCNHPEPGRWLASVSPERFLRLTCDSGRSVAEVCPIKGTTPRGCNPEQDQYLAEKLRADAKERAEHLMVVDLERNDLGQECVPGSVKVDALYDIVQTDYCHQMVSTVTGELLASATVGGLLEAAFPCGSVTGAPKIAAMRIAAEHEGRQRGLYCGSLAVAVSGQLDSSVLIRSLEGHGSSAQWGAGCGITYESDPAAEYLELQLKASPVCGDGLPGVALRESMRVVHGVVPLLDRHLSRLASGGVGPSLLSRVRGAVQEQLLCCPDEPYARLSLTVTPDGEVSAGLTTERSTLEVPGGPRLVPVRVEQLPALPPRAAKPAARRYWDRAHNTARLAGGDQAALVGPDGMLIDGSTASIWLVRNGVLLTPPAPPAIAGVAREVVFDLAYQLGLVAEERPVTERDLDEASEVFLTNAVGIIVPVAGREGEVFRKLSSLLEEAMALG